MFCKYPNTQILAKHSNEVRALQELLRKAWIRCESQSRCLRRTEKELLNAKDSLNRLQLLSKACDLEERVELNHRLNLVNVDLDRKGKRIQDLERNLEQRQISFSRHLATETRKTSEARELSDYLQAQISQLTQKIKERERELDIHNIYAHRFPKNCNRKGARETKSVQTDNLSSLPIEPPCQLGLKTSRIEHLESGMERQKSLSWEHCANDFIDRSDLTGKSVDDRGPTDPEDLVEYGEQDGDSDREDFQLQDEQFLVKEKVSSPLVSDEEQTEKFESQVRQNLEDLNLECANTTLKSPSRTKRLYTFKETIQNLHCGKPAYSSHTHSLRRSPPKYINSQARVENLGSGVYEPSFVTLPEGKSQRHDITGPKPEDGVVQSKKSSLMKELFGQASITDKMAMQTSTSKVQSTVLDRMSF
uniref:Lebercilin-like protein n=1 Tax=Esox lucius TaxID=8010 RepID=A0A6Q2WQT4_ESOLU